MQARGQDAPCPRCLLRICMAEDDEEKTSEAPREAPGTVIGRYTLIEEIGEGGFGIVYLAEQAAPVRRKVALKVLKPGMDTREVVARFKVERQALALMDHPHIAQVYDGGATDSGRPYFVMELVNGKPITTYCKEQRLTVRQRLELFLDVTAAVQHAHQKGIIHRDLKPSNIMVSMHEGRPAVKVIDFGVSKAVAMNLTETAVMTALGRMIGTPEYMSPEQADLNAIDVDTRSDIYSLGVVLYEMLTGTTPLEPGVLRKAGFTEMLRMIREDKPPKPSSRISSLIRDGGRELDWVVMQALEKDPARRYQTAIGLGLDIRRFLDDEPVSASPPSASYRFAKFARRHRFAVAWTGVFTVVVIAAAIGMTMLYFDAGRKAKVASDQRAVAEIERQKASDQRAAAEIERQKANAAGELARTNTWRSHMRLAGELRWSGKPEGRYKAFDALREAAAIGSELKEPGNLKWLRDSVIACLSMVDMKPLPPWDTGSDISMVSAGDRLTNYAMAFPDGRIRVHRLEVHRPVCELPGHGEPPGGVLRFNPDGSRLAAAYGSNERWTLKLWNLAGETASIDAGPGVHKAFDFFPDGKRAVIGRPEGGIAIMDVVSGAEILRHDLTGEIQCLAVSRTGKWLAAGIADAATRPGRLEILDAVNGSTVASLFCAARVVAWSPFDDSLAVGCGDSVLRVWHDEDWKSAGLALQGHTKELNAVAWSPDGRLLASQSADGTVRLWDPFQGGKALSWHPGRCDELRFNGDGSRLGIFRDGETLHLMEVTSGDVCYRGRRHVGAVGVFDGVWNPEGTLLATSGDDGVRLWNREGRQLGFLRISGSRGLAFTEDSLYIASEGGLQRRRMAEETAEDEIRFLTAETIGSFASCGQISLSRDEGLLALTGRGADANEETAMWLIDLKNNVEPRRLDAPRGVHHCAFSHDGEWLAAGTLHGNGVRIWPVGDTSNPVDLPVRGTARVAFSHDKERQVRRLVTGDSEAYRFWEIGSWKPKGSIVSEMRDSCGVMTFSPRETVLAIACRGAELKVYDPWGAMELSSPDFDREIPLCFDPDGKFMITTGQSGGVFFWKLDEVRRHLEQQGKAWNLPSPGLDWAEMPAFPEKHRTIVKRVVISGADF